MLALLVTTLVPGLLGVQAGRTTPRFYPDDPLLIDDDAAFDASGAKEVELSEVFDFLLNTFTSPGDRSPIRALNVNTVDEVPDSSWFTNRIGIRNLTVEGLRRGPNKFERLDAAEWRVVEGKGPGGFQPGFRAVHPGDPEQVYQIEIDPVRHPQLATGAELIGTLVYHALGYHVQDVYTLKVDPGKVSISEKATIRDASGRRRFSQHDLDSIWQQAARDADGRVYVSATRYEEGEDLGQFEYHGTRSDDPNDIYPHEHRRELRANRVFAAWLAHDDSRAVNTRNIRVEANGRAHIRHYMHDFGAILGSATRFAEPATNNHEYVLGKSESLRALATLGLSVPVYLRADPADPPPSVGRFDSVTFDPARWKPNYPNAAFLNMQPDDAFWGARLVSRFSDQAIRAIVGRAEYDDVRATEHLARALIERRDAIARAWLTVVNPIVDPALAGDGTFTFTNAAVAAGVSSPATGYAITWSRFDNATGAQDVVPTAARVTETRARAPTALLAASEFVVATIRSEHPEFPAWRKPVTVYFRRTGIGWTLVGLLR